MEGVAGFWGAQDVPGDPCIGPVFPDEACFAGAEVTAVGQVIGVLAADTHELARRAAAAVKVRASALLHASPAAVLLLDGRFAFKGGGCYAGLRV